MAFACGFQKGGEGMAEEEHIQATDNAAEIASLRAELAEIRDRETRLRLAVRLSRVAVYTVDRDLRIDWLDKPQIPGVAESFIGQQVGFWCRDDDAQRLRASYAAVLASQREQQISHTLQLKDNGKPYHFDVIARPRLDEHGQVCGLMCAAFNVTEERQREEDLRKAKQVAERAVAEKNRFLAAASHDLRQPLQAIGFLQYAIASHVADMDDPTLHELADKLGTAVQATQELLDRLMDHAVLEAGSLVPKVETFPVVDLLDAKRADFGQLAEVKGLTLRVCQCSQRVKSDPVLLKRILRNFVVNALKFTERGGVLIGCRRRNGHLRIEVWDTGVGIPADKLSVIFEAFAQVGECAVTRSQGVGLGLSIAADTAKLLGHEIGVTSKPGKGSCFWVLVPFVE
ncbi:MAG: sensor histidine kinase [Alphaproteobacteria bacterium]